jgi:hypothetical protein
MNTQGLFVILALLVNALCAAGLAAGKLCIASDDPAIKNLTIVCVVLIKK